MRLWLKSRTAVEMSVADAAWLAGFFDGEGSLCRCTSGAGKKSWRMAIPNTNLGALQKCQAITGSGNICEKKFKMKPEHWKMQWSWSVHAQRDIAAIVRQMLPYLTVKRDAANDFMAMWTDV